MIDFRYTCEGIPEGFYEDPGLSVPWTLRESGEVPTALYYHKDNERVVKAVLTHIREDFSDLNKQLAAVRTITAVDTQHMTDFLKGLEAAKQRADIIKQVNEMAAADRVKEGTAPTQVSLSGDPLEHLQQLATSQGITLEEALRKAIATESYLYKEMQAGSKVLLLTADKEVREVLFR